MNKIQKAKKGSSEICASQGCEFLDDAIRIKDQPLSKVEMKRQPNRSRINNLDNSKKK